MYRFRANSRATISSTAIFLSQQSRQYFSSPLGSETSFAPHGAPRDLTTALRGILTIYNLQFTMSKPSPAIDVLAGQSSRSKIALLLSRLVTFYFRSNGQT